MVKKRTNSSRRRPYFWSQCNIFCVAARRCLPALPIIWRKKEDRRPRSAVDGCIFCGAGMQNGAGGSARGHTRRGSVYRVPPAGGRGALHRRRDAGEREQEDGSGDGKRHKDLFLNPFEHGGPPPFLHAASAAPSARQLLSAASSGASWVMTLSAASTAPAAIQSASQLRIHSPSPHP